ncbi:MAG: FRG domain-containing protein [Anaerolineae bacterium]|nr:FRG domain-containing protein [Anaerolineae bacterium]
MDTSNDIRVQSWDELNEVVFLDSWRDDLQRFRSPFAFRGLSDARYELLTSLMRMSGDYARLEPAVLRNFRKYAVRDASPGESIWSWLAVAQHHGLPTRLLDWSNSPYVAAHFATAELDKYDRDGVIWCVRVWEIQGRMPGVLRHSLEEEYAVLCSVDILARVANSLPEFDRLAQEPFPVFFDPPALDERIVNQFALFSMMSSPTARLDHWLERHPEAYLRVVIPAETKWEIRDKLDQINMTERVLFPGLDGLSSWLKRYYSPRQTRPNTS